MLSLRPMYCLDIQSARDTVDGVHLASPNMCYATIVPRLMVYIKSCRMYIVTSSGLSHPKYQVPVSTMGTSGGLGKDLMA